MTQVKICVTLDLDAEVFSAEAIESFVGIHLQELARDLEGYIVDLEIK